MKEKEANKGVIRNTITANEEIGEAGAKKRNG